MNYFKDRFNGMKDYQVTLKHENENEYPGVEYRDIGHFFGNAFSVWRMSRVLLLLGTVSTAIWLWPRSVVFGRWALNRMFMKSMMQC